MAKKKRAHEILAQQKTEYLRELLKENALALPDDLNNKIIAKFHQKGAKKPGGLGKAEISEVRWKEFGVKFGPGGRAYDKAGKMVYDPKNAPKAAKKPPTKAAVAQPNAERSEEASTQRLQQLISGLREEMGRANIDSVTIPLSGKISSIQRVEREIDV